MDKWIPVVTDPLGLAGFALFLVFSFLSLKRRSLDAHWIMASFITLAAVGLLGGLGLAYLRSGQTGPSPSKETGAPPVAQREPAPNGQQTSSPARQETHGSQSPTVSGVQGNVTIIERAVPGSGEQRANITGKWASGTLTNPYESDNKYTLLFEFVLQGDAVIGSIIESGMFTETGRTYEVASAIQNGKLQDRVSSFHTEFELEGKDIGTSKCIGALSRTTRFDLPVRIMSQPVAKFCGSLRSDSRTDLLRVLLLRRAARRRSSPGATRCAAERSARTAPARRCPVAGTSTRFSRLWDRKCRRGTPCGRWTVTNTMGGCSSCGPPIRRADAPLRAKPERRAAGLAAILAPDSLAAREEPPERNDGVGSTVRAETLPLVSSGHRRCLWRHQGGLRARWVALGVETAIRNRVDQSGPVVAILARDTIDHIRHRGGAPLASRGSSPQARCQEARRPRASPKRPGGRHGESTPTRATPVNFRA